ncbi:cation diffusion facilitator family transporter [Sphingomonas oryzagri]|uniref:Cation diffusion facilitator family transporter n=1 Tax=Sphingomonas oryzagri TaxID=3042314 RepID=A0ABT6N588_9SPHN|nr:cation diffusion facilitator family transporter [Sphingomonas oryzagri]MDH7640267.1 cation diffusion facilitator family transporter [Sphingomonas oryzagri]
MDDCCSRKSEALNTLAQSEQRRVLIVVMILNLAMFVAEFGAGLVAQSTALMADSVDMLGDAIVYALSLYAIARGSRWEAGAALAKGGLILAFGIVIIAQSLLKISTGGAPSSTIMLAFSGIALAVNLACLALLWRFRNTNVNMSSTFECSRNDVVANLGVFVAGGLIAFTNSPWPDIVVGLAIAALFVRSAVRVLRSAWPVWRHESRSTKVVLR